MNGETMNSSLARQFLMRSLALPKKTIEYQRERVQSGKCIIEGCDGDLSVRGLCENHKRLYYQELAKQPNEKARIKFEEDCVRDGLILPAGYQTRLRAKNPFARVG